jgi:hypothetical protein
LTISGDPNSPYVGFDRLKAFLLSTGSFTHRRLSLVPSFKIQIDIHGKEALFYEECHDVQDFDLPSRFIAADSFLAPGKRRPRVCTGNLCHSDSNAVLISGSQFRETKVAK